MDDDLSAEPKAKSGSKKIILIVVMVLVLLGGGGAAVYLSGMLETEEGPEGSVKVEAPPLPADTVFHQLPTLITNVAGKSGRPGFLKFTVSLGLADLDVLPQLRRFEPRIIDILQVYFRELRIDDLRESRGIPILRHELLQRINMAIHPAEITSVLLKEILIQ